MEAASAELEPLSPEPDFDPSMHPIAPPLAPPIAPSASSASQSSAPPQPAPSVPPVARPTVQQPPRAAAPATVAPATVAPIMDRDFIARNQIVERYFSGRLPIKGATEFERFCTKHPELLDELGVPERVHVGLRLLEASGKPEPWQETPKQFWAKPQIVFGLAAAVLVLLISTMLFASRAADRARKISALTQQVADQPLEPATTTRTIRLLPNKDAAVTAPAVTIGGAGQTQLADLKIDMSHSPYREFRITIDRVDQGRVAIIHNLAKDSNGHLRIALNSSALGPGTYQLTIEGLTWRGEPEPDAWITIAVQH
ncbi:MAG TPA: hypothetical protein VMG11_04325 [Steroidobacteraceae bacterium]|nr:hypothetical protein [Steroidobacteraceae bacterium]